jgi:hypothetical protein
MALFSLYLIYLGFFPSVREVIEAYLVVGLLGAGTSLVAVWVLARLPYVAVALMATAVAGFLAGYTWGLLTYGSGAEDGTVWRGYGGAIVGAASAIAAWFMLRWAHRFLSRGACATNIPQYSPGP